MHTHNSSRRSTPPSKLMALAASILLGSSLLTPKLAYGDDDGRFRHVLFISIDGMHAPDMAVWIKNNPNSALTKLSTQGLMYTNASSTKPSDSIPSAVGIFTGASPATGGTYYDDAYNHAMGPPPALPNGLEEP